jgi:hypothetical protein
VNPCVFEIADVDIDKGTLTREASFADERTLTLSAEGRGQVSGGGVFANGTSVTATAIPAPRSSFVRWEVIRGAACPTQLESTTCGFLITNDVELKAVFASIVLPQTSRIGTVGTPITPLEITVTGVSGNITFGYTVVSGMSDLHGGLSIEKTGPTTARIVGTPTEDGDIAIRVTATYGDDSLDTDAVVISIAEASAPSTTAPATTVPATTVPGAPDPDTNDPDEPAPGTTVPGTEDPDAPGPGDGADHKHPGSGGQVLPSAGTGLNNLLSAMGVLLLALGALVLMGTSTRRRMVES